jgi:hypothetical protein
LLLIAILSTHFTLSNGGGEDYAKQVSLKGGQQREMVGFVMLLAKYLLTGKKKKNWSSSIKLLSK